MLTETKIITVIIIIITLSSELKKLWNLKRMVMSVIIGAHGTETKSLVRNFKEMEIRGP